MLGTIVIRPSGWYERSGVGGCLFACFWANEGHHARAGLWRYLPYPRGNPLFLMIVMLSRQVSLVRDVGPYGRAAGLISFPLCLTFVGGRCQMRVE